MPELTTETGITINFECWGDPESPPVVLLHDAGGDLRDWHAVALELAGGYRVVALDLRGHGCSTAPESEAEMSDESMLGDLDALLKSLDIELAAFGGSGLGAWLCLEFALREPERVPALILTDLIPDPSIDGAGPGEEMVQRVGPAGLGKHLAKAIGDPFLAEGIRRRQVRASGEGYAGALRARRAAAARFDEQAPSASMPVLVCAGSDDPNLDAAMRFADGIPGAAAVVIHDAPRGLPGHRPAELASAVLDFLTAVEEQHQAAQTTASPQ